MAMVNMTSARAKNGLMKGERKGKPETFWRQFRSPDVKNAKIVFLKTSIKVPMTLPLFKLD